MRIGLIGTQSSHVDEFLNSLPSSHRVLFALGSRDLPGVPRVNSPTDLVGRVDGVVCFERDARRHRAQVVDVLGAGLPVFVDKPFAASAADARAMLTAGRVTSFSALRWAPEVAAIAAQPSRGRTLVVEGPADPADPNAGVAFYGVHLVEMALQVAGGPLESGRVERSSAGAVATLVLGGAPVIVRLTPPGSPIRIGYDDAMTDVRIGPGYFDTAAAHVRAFLGGASSPVSREQLLDGATVVEALLRALPAPAVHEGGSQKSGA